jgi:hypothetical protein
MNMVLQNIASPKNEWTYIICRTVCRDHKLETSPVGINTGETLSFTSSSAIKSGQSEQHI